MNRKQFGELISVLRRELFDEYGERWTQTQLARETGLSKILISTIERGQKVHLEKELLMNLADALQLTSGERKAFFAEASGIDSVLHHRKNTDTQKALEAGIDTLRQICVPALVISDTAEILAMNYLFSTLSFFPLEDMPKLPESPTRTNLLRFLYGSEYQHLREMMGESWHSISYELMMFFRCNSFHRRATPEFREILASLRKQPRFRQVWDTIQVHEIDYKNQSIFCQIEHPAHGTLRFGTALQQLLEDDGLHIYTMLPMTPHSLETCATVLEQQGLNVLEVYKL